MTGISNDLQLHASLVEPPAAIHFRVKCYTKEGREREISFQPLAEDLSEALTLFNTIMGRSSPDAELSISSRKIVEYGKDPEHCTMDSEVARLRAIYEKTAQKRGLPSCGDPVHHSAARGTLNGPQICSQTSIRIAQLTHADIHGIEQRIGALRTNIEEVIAANEGKISGEKHPKVLRELKNKGHALKSLKRRLDELSLFAVQHALNFNPGSTGSEFEQRREDVKAKIVQPREEKGAFSWIKKKMAKVPGPLTFEEEQFASDVALLTISDPLEYSRQCRELGIIDKKSDSIEFLIVQYLRAKSDPEANKLFDHPILNSACVDVNMKTELQEIFKKHLK